MIPTIRILSDRRAGCRIPASLPAAAEIYNAPRPLMGDKTWAAEFVCGIHYAAVVPGTEWADTQRAMNERDDAVRLTFIEPSALLAEYQTVIAASERAIDWSRFDAADVFNMALNYLVDLNYVARRGQA